MEEAKKYLSDILQAIELIEVFTKEQHSFSDYQQDLKTKSAVERQLSIIGEAANQYRKKFDQPKLTNANQIIATRNRLIHSYDSIDDTIVWAIIQKHLPILKSEVLINLKDK